MVFFFNDRPAAPYFVFGAAIQNDTLSTIKKIFYEDTMAKVHWQEDWTTSIAESDILQPERLVSKKQVSSEFHCCSKRTFNRCIKAACSLLD